MLSHTISLESDIEPELLREIGEHDVEETSAVIHVVNINDFDALDDKAKAPQNTQLTIRRLLLTLLFSIALHILAFYIISLRVQLPTFSEETTAPIIVQAKLYTPPPPPVPQEPIERATPEPIDVPEIDTSDTPAEAPATPEVDREITIEEQVTAEEPVSITPEQIEEIVPESAPLINEAVDSSVDETLTPSPLSATRPPRSIYSNRAFRDLKSLEQQKRNSMANQAFKEFQYSKTHPDIETTPKTALQLTDEERRQIADEQLLSTRPTIKANCKNAAGKALNVIGYLVGGAVECKKNPELRSFIKNRLDKSNNEK